MNAALESIFGENCIENFRNEGFEGFESFMVHIDSMFDSFRINFLGFETLNSSNHFIDSYVHLLSLMLN